MFDSFTMVGMIGTPLRVVTRNTEPCLKIHARILADIFVFDDPQIYRFITSVLDLIQGLKKTKNLAYKQPLNGDSYPKFFAGLLRDFLMLCYALWCKIDLGGHKLNKI